VPIYEYRCNSCGMQKEFLQRMSDDLLTDCSSCGGKGTLAKMLSAAGFQLKGSGWYATDFKNGTKPAAATPATTATADAPAKTDSSAKDAPAKTESTASTAPASAATAVAGPAAKAS
jgi:putative FmdB family regulatory protein